MTGFAFGPAWASGTTCCGKPAGCTNMSGQCLMRNHPWKRRYREQFAVQEDSGARDGSARAEEESGDEPGAG